MNEILKGTKEIPSSMRYGITESFRELQTNNQSSADVEISYRYYFRGYVLFHGKIKLITRKAKRLDDER